MRRSLPAIAVVLALAVSAAAGHANAPRAGAAQSGATGATGATGPTGPTGPPEAPGLIGNGPHNRVVVNSTVDGQAVTGSSVQIGATRSEDVSNENLAWSVPYNCSGCQGIAAALQVAFYKQNPPKFEPVNLAVAVNTRCTGCVAFAYAYQYDVATRDGHVRLTHAAWRQIADLRHQVQADVREAAQTRDLATLDGRLHALAGQLRDTVDDALANLHVHENAGRTQQRDTAHPASAR